MKFKPGDVVAYKFGGRDYVGVIRKPYKHGPFWFYWIRRSGHFVGELYMRLECPLDRLAKL
jgi:hypothetical protein